MSRNRHFLISKYKRLYNYFYFHKPQMPKVPTSTVRYFSYIYMSYQMYITWSCVTFYCYLEFHKQMTTVLVLPENDLIQTFNEGLHGFILNWTYLILFDFYEKNPCKQKKVPINHFDVQEKPRIFLKIFQKKTKISKPFEPF